MLANYILAALAVVFLVAAAFGRATGRPSGQSATWFLVGAIFALVSVFLFVRR